MLWSMLTYLVEFVVNLIVGRVAASDRHHGGDGEDQVPHTPSHADLLHG